MRNEDQWRNRRRDESDMDREFPRDRDYGAASRYPRDEPFQFGDTDRGPRGGSYRESGRQYGGYDAPRFGRGGASGSGYGADPRYGERLQSVQGGNFGRGEPYVDEGRYGGSHHEGYGLTGQRYMPKGYKRSDARLQEDICERLSHSGLDVSAVSVTVSNGQVTLEGSVSERYMKHAIEDYADDCMGVEGIENRIRVERSGSHSASGSTGSTSSLSGQASSPRPEARTEAGNADTAKGQAGKSPASPMQEGASEQTSRSARKSGAQSKRK